MTKVDSLTYVVFVIPAPNNRWEAICPSLGCSAVASTATGAIEATRAKMIAALTELKAVGRSAPIESGYAVADEMEERLRIQDESGLPISMATHEVRVDI